jgi:hypothetical protein
MHLSGIIVFGAILAGISVDLLEKEESTLEMLILTHKHDNINTETFVLD